MSDVDGRRAPGNRGSGVDFILRVHAFFAGFVSFSDTFYLLILLIHILPPQICRKNILHCILWTHELMAAMNTTGSIDFSFQSTTHNRVSNAWPS